MPDSSELIETFRAAAAHHRAGRMSEAELLYRKVLASDPAHPDSLHLLGLICHQTGRGGEAVELIARAAALKPENAQYAANLGMVLAASGRAERAISSYERALALRPFPETYFNLGNALRAASRTSDAIAAYKKAGELRPDFVEALSNLAATLHDAGQFDEAIAVYEQVVKLRPELSQAWTSLGWSLRQKGDTAASVDAYRRAAELSPDSAEIRFSLGEALMAAREYDQATVELRRTLELRPQWIAPLSTLGAALHSVGDVRGALRCHETLLAKAMDPMLGASLFQSLYYDASLDMQAIFEQHRLWNERHARALAPRANAYPTSPERDSTSTGSVKSRIRIGYLSADFCQHVSSFFTIPLLSHHDRSAFEVYCYADVKRPDELTELHRRQADVWRNASGMHDEQVAQIIRDDRIDVLVDLALHSAGNRLLVFARKPAPVQLTWLACAGTSGLDTIDYRLSDRYLDPDPAGDLFYSEKTVRLPNCFWCYDPLSDEPPVNDLPAMKNGFVTFGSLNAIAKATAEAVSMWAAVLRAVPGSRLLLHAPPGSARKRVTDLLARHGLESCRATFVERQPRSGYLATFHRIDIALDPFPYGGGTTTFDTLWMGVPVVTLTGKTSMSRAGSSILSNLGFPQWIAGDVETYVRIAAELASDLTRLSELRARMRDRMRASPLMDAGRFARDFEAAVRWMWGKWCRQRASVANG
jgi:predicted O-linked N-acetylglucosamine transferase (SPINDLY family)